MIAGLGGKWGKQDVWGKEPVARDQALKDQLVSYRISAQQTGLDTHWSNAKAPQNVAAWTATSSLSPESSLTRCRPISTARRMLCPA